MNHLDLPSSASSSTQRTRFDCQPGWPGKPRSGLSHVTLPTFVPAGAFSLSEKICGDGTLGASETRTSVTATVALILVEGLPRTWAVTTTWKTPFGTTWIESAVEFCTLRAPVVESM